MTMAFNPYGYQNPYYLPPMQDNLMQMRQQQMMPQQTPMQQSVVWISGGEAEANGYMLAPNTSVFLMDENAHTFYTKARYANGTPSPLRIFDYTERTKTPENAEKPAPSNEEKYVTQDEFEKIRQTVIDLKSALEKMEDASNGN